LQPSLAGVTVPLTGQPISNRRCPEWAICSLLFAFVSTNQSPAKQQEAWRFGSRRCPYVMIT